MDRLRTTIIIKHSVFLIRKHLLPYIVVALVIAYMVLTASDKLIPLAEVIPDKFRSNIPFFEMIVAFLLHQIIMKAAILHFTIQNIRIPEISIRDWYRSIHIEDTIKAFLRFLGIYTILLFMFGTIFLLLFVSGYLVAMEIEKPQGWPIPTPSSFSLFVIVLISFMVPIPLVARYWLAVPNAILSTNGVISCLQKSATQTKGNILSISLIICLATLPCIGIFFLAIQYIENEFWSSVVILLAISTMSLFDTVAVSTSYWKLAYSKASEQG